jgi:hypothetical protein
MGLYLVVTRYTIDDNMITVKQYFTPENLDKYYWRPDGYYDIQNQVKEEMRQKMMQGECFISYKVPTGPFVYIYAFKLFGCN